MVVILFETLSRWGWYELVYWSNSGAWNQNDCASVLVKTSFFQDPDASFDFNDFDGDPKPRDENLENW